MESDKKSSETIPLSVINANANETPQNESEKISQHSSTEKVTDENVAIDIAGNLDDHVPHVEENITPHEAYNVVVPDYLLDQPPDSNNTKTADNKKAGTDVPDGFNEYRNKKTLTQGMMDVALFSANVNQLRSILDQLPYSNSHVYAGIIICMLVVSILLQVGVGLLLLLSTRYNVNSAEERRIVYRYGNYVVAGIFLVTVVNVFISAFGTPGDRYIPDERYSSNFTTSKLS